MPVLSTRALTKRFGAVTAVDSVDLELRSGEVLGLLGPNGAGKTTTLRVLLGLAKPTSGEVRVLDGRPGDPDVLRRIGSVVEEPALYPYLSGRDQLRVLARYTGTDEAAIAPALGTMGLLEAANVRTRDYSLGMRQRLAIAGALLKDPDVLLLDEPTNGLDPAGIQAMRGFLRDAAAAGKAVMLSSHLLAEVEQICDRVVVLFEGRKVADAPVDELRSQEVLVVTADPLDRAHRIVVGLDVVESAELRDGRLRVTASPGSAADINQALVSAGVRVSLLAPATQSLEEAFFALTRPGGA